jgi:hypothetical protein
VDENSIDYQRYVDLVGSVPSVLTRANFPALSALQPSDPLTREIISLSTGVGGSYYQENSICNNGSVVIRCGHMYITSGFPPVTTIPFAVSRSTDDGVTWTTVFTDSSRPYSAQPAQDGFAVMWDGSRFIAARAKYNETNVDYYTSPDGLTWTYEKTTTTDQLASASVQNFRMYGNNSHVFIEPKSGTMKFSTDPIAGSFADVTTPPTNAQTYYSISGTHYKFTAGVTLGSVYYSSTDGATWSAGGTASAGVGTGSGHMVSTSAGYFIGTSTGYILKSTDMLTWTSIYRFGSGSTSVAEIASYNDELVVLLGTSGIYLGNQYYTYTSTDGATWVTNTSRSLNPYLNPIFSNYPLTVNFTSTASGSIMKWSHDPATEVILPAIKYAPITQSPAGSPAGYRKIRATYVMRVK